MEDLNDADLLSLMQKRYLHKTKRKLEGKDILLQLFKEKREFLDYLYDYCIKYRYFNPTIKKGIKEIINKLSLKFKLFVITDKEIDFTTNFLKKHGLATFFEEVYSIRDLTFHEREKIFKRIVCEQKISENDFLYLVGNAPLIFKKQEIINFTRKFNFFEIKKYYPYKNEKLNFKNSLVTFDLDGTLTDSSNHNFLKFKTRKAALEEFLNLSITDEEFFIIWRDLKNEHKILIKTEGYKKYDEELVVAKGVVELIKELSKRNVLILFSVTSRKRVEHFLKKRNLLNYFKRIYSAKDDFYVKIKKDLMFKKIKSDFPGYNSYVHIGDLPFGDYFESKKAGFIPILVDNSEILEVSINKLLKDI